MIEERFKKLEEQIAASPTIPDETRAELLRLLGTLHSEITALPAAHAQDAQSIAAFAEASAHEATRVPVKPRLLEAALTGLAGSVEEFETTHPDLAAAINRFSMILANMGM